MYKFMQEIPQLKNRQLKTFYDLYEYSVNNRAQFWDLAFKYIDMIYSGTYSKVVDESARIDSIPSWFEGVKVNFAENVLYAHDRGTPSGKRSTRTKEDDKIAVVEVREGGTEIKNISWKELRSDTARLASAMKAHGIEKGDRVAIVASHSFDTLRVVLAVTSLGGIYTSSSTDMGTKGILQRLLQIEPKYIFMDDSAIFNGKKFDLREKMTEIVNEMKDVKEFEGVISMPRFDPPANIGGVPRSMLLKDFEAKSTSSEPSFEKMEFRDPFVICYSSGTTGTPKCIVHSIGGSLISSGKESLFHRHVAPSDVGLQYTTTGWIMYLTSVMTLQFGAKVVLYDGSPFLPNPESIINLLSDLKVTLFGTSPRWMQEMIRRGIKPREVADLSALRVVTSTGMVLTDQLFEWFYDEGFPKHAQLANISGGTDIAGCFGQENPLTPLYVGGCQGPSLGTPIAVYDSLIEGGKGVTGATVNFGEPGELVATAAFPNMPVFFWGDDGSKYFSAYFEKYDNVWTHGDFVSIHPVTKGLYFLGRADGVLNPSGVRFGSAEIYSVLESHFSADVADSICVGQRRPQDADETVLLFLLMKPGVKFTQELVTKVKTAIRKELSARHVPKYVFETPDIPTTINLKKVELPVKQIVSGKIIKPSGTLANPQSLDYYYRFAKIEQLVGPKSKI